MDSTQDNTQGNIPLQCFTLNKCSTNSIVKIRVCINCGNAYHAGCLKKMKNISYLKGFLIKCCEKKRQSSFNNKSNDDLNSSNSNLELKKLIDKYEGELKTYKNKYDEAILKYNSILTDLNNTDSKNKYSELEKKYNSILEDNTQLRLNTLNKYNNSTIEELDDSLLHNIDPTKFLIRENKLLFKLNKELQEKCDLLKDNIQLLKLNKNINIDNKNNTELSNNNFNNSNSVNKTFSEALLTDNKKNSFLFVKSSNTKTALQDIKTTISPTELHAKVHFIKQQKNGNNN